MRWNFLKKIPTFTSISRIKSRRARSTKNAEQFFCFVLLYFYQMWASLGKPILGWKSWKSSLSLHKKVIETTSIPMGQKATWNELFVLMFCYWLVPEEQKGHTFWLCRKQVKIDYHFLSEVRFKICDSSFPVELIGHSVLSHCRIRVLEDERKTQMWEKRPWCLRYFHRCLKFNSFALMKSNLILFRDFVRNLNLSATQPLAH